MKQNMQSMFIGQQSGLCLVKTILAFMTSYLKIVTGSKLDL